MTADGLGRAVGETHRRYTNFINTRGRWTGHLFQRRFASVAMDAAHLLTAARYVGRGPVRARPVGYASDWPWSGVRAHMAGMDDELAVVAPLLQRIDDFAAYMAVEEERRYDALRRSEGTGRPAGAPEFVAGLERLLGRPIARRAPGGKRTQRAADQLDLLQWAWCRGIQYSARTVRLFTVSFQGCIPHLAIAAEKGLANITPFGTLPSRCKGVGA